MSVKFDKKGIVSANNFSEGFITKTLDNGSKWACIYKFNYDVAGSIWTKDQAIECDDAGKFSRLGLLNDFTTKSGWLEFWYTEATPPKYVRWKQSYNPLSRYTSSTSGTSSEYTFISGTTPYSGFAGLTRYTADDSKSCYLRGAPSWWCAIAPYQTSYDVFPAMWGTSTNNHKQELWIRLDDALTLPAFTRTDTIINATSIMSAEIIEN